MIARSRRWTVAAAFIVILSSARAYAEPLLFGVVGSPIDISANVRETILPANTPVFQDSKPLFGTTPDPKQTSDLLHVSAVGVNPSSHSNLSDAFASSLAESDGNGGVGVSQLIFGSPGGGQNGVRELVAQSLWTQTFVYTGSPTIDILLHLQIPALQVELFGVPPNRDFPSATETAKASASVRTVITHPDGSFSQGGSFDVGLSEFETQLLNPDGGFLNFADVAFIGTAGTIFAPPVHEESDFPRSRVKFGLDSFSTSVDLGALHTGDTLAYVYTLTAQGTTRGFERGYDAFLGDPFGAEPITDNLRITVVPTDAPTPVPEPASALLTGIGLAGMAFARRRTVADVRSASADRSGKRRTAVHPVTANGRGAKTPSDFMSENRD